MNIKNTLSLITILAIGTQSLMATVPAEEKKIQDRDSSYTVDFKGSLSGSLLTSNACGIDTGLDFKISEEYLRKQDFDANMSVGIMTLGIASPSTISDSTIQISFPSIMDVDAIETAGDNIIDLDDNNNTALTYSHRDGTSNTLIYDTAASTDLVNGHRYCIGDSTGCKTLPYHLNKGTTKGTYAGDIEWSIYSNSGTSERRDYGILPVKLIVEPQFSIRCVSKLDALINWENDRKSFVVHKHGLDAGSSVDVQDTVTDSLIFTVENKAGVRTSDNACTNGLHDYDLWLDGTGTNFVITATNSEDLNTADWNLSLTSPRTGVVDGTTTWRTPDTAIFTTDATQGIFNGSTTYKASYNHQLGYDINATIPETTFSGTVELDGVSGLEPLATPLTTKDKSNLGEWMNHAYIAQIAGAEIGGIQNMKTKFFITNRSCSVAIPTFNVILDGQIYSVQAGSIDVDTQKVFLLKDIVDADTGLKAALENADDSLKVAVEIVLAGVAEDFYIYAQVKNSTLKQFKDLPVYTTSNRH